MGKKKSLGLAANRKTEENSARDKVSQGNEEICSKAKITSCGGWYVPLQRTLKDNKTTYTLHCEVQRNDDAIGERNKCMRTIEWKKPWGR